MENMPISPVLVVVLSILSRGPGERSIAVFPMRLFN